MPTADRLVLQAHASHAASMAQQVEALQDAGTHAIETYVSMVTTRQGQVINWLTFVSIVFLPLTFITGFFGMNFDWMVNNVTSPAAFWILGVGLPGRGRGAWCSSPAGSCSRCCAGRAGQPGHRSRRIGGPAAERRRVASRPWPSAPSSCVPRTSPTACRRPPARAMLRAVGMGDDDWDKPQIGVASSWNEVTPCNLHAPQAGRAGQGGRARGRRLPARVRHHHRVRRHLDGARGHARLARVA